ncbi:Asp-tRNA(Asn)/Glu-tRNA(Gln) amidotransferase GatCAB subunit A [Natrarchaeobius halalkaliphilus]|uniref:Asp-tRNA(Asn)/Glu-tRNA(Gln) amidotransferase GatCAB subunit A n=1 Tax=Natrarchaeobius halalkaliphilus TaxID=1679091 RepID=A0A3N6P0N3_9EURY|nr:amidase family protein [Natrarchaeobius halalkaliphilus]RQG88078.1 Asp-tRNA(Asn)/Glu-tRNA(Gln) amidotransferase GatCAB subunit A [Natrarchaeobius halalkaliphilus]
MFENYVRDVATRLGIDLDEDNVTTYAKQVDELTTQFDRSAVDPSSNRPAVDVEPGTDAYNAIRYHCRVTNDEMTTRSGDGRSLSGVDVVVKENIAVAGVPMHCGSEAVDFEPGYHATVVSRLIDAGVNVVGTTNMDELAYFTTGETCAFGPTDNPVVDGCVPGGSSSGSAAAVAGELVEAALGSDTGGSVRIPSSFCGIVGLKPTHRSVPRFGFADLSPSLDQIGPIARTVETVAQMYDVLAGPDVRDRSTHASSPAKDATEGVGESVDGRCIAVIGEAMDEATTGVSDQVERAVETLEGTGVDTTDVSVPEYRTATAAMRMIAGSEFAALCTFEGHIPGSGTGHSESWRSEISTAIQSPDLGENVREQIVTASALNEYGLEQYVTAQEIAAEFTETIATLLEEYDALLTPTTPMTAPTFGSVTSPKDFTRTIANTAPFNLTGHPALTVPHGTVNGAPVGVQFVGARYDERTLMAFGSELTA